MDFNSLLRYQNWVPQYASGPNHWKAINIINMTKPLILYTGKKLCEKLEKTNIS